ncbi:MAG: flippase-like domain-containing protein [Deltaproteobacteria bacterium]|nr:flippase-like domain-containing protein [Deltaproteobacteria bacterium]
MIKSRKMFWFGIILSLALIILLVQRTDIHKLALAFRQANYLYCLPVIAVALLGILIRAYRWGHILAPLHRASRKNLFSAMMIGFMAIDILPARIGEVARAVLIGRKEPISKTSALATIVVERLFDIFTLLLLLVWVLFAMSHSTLPPVYIRTLKAGGTMMAALFVGVLLFLVFLRFNTGVALNFVRFCLRPFPHSLQTKTLELMDSFVAGLTTIRMGRDLLWIIFYSVLLWSLYGIGNLFMLRSFGIRTPVYVPFYLVIVQAFAVGIPSSPGFVGTYDAAVVAGLAPFHADEAVRLSFALLSHFLIFLPVILYGLILLWREHLTLDVLEREAGTEPEETEG